MSIESLQYRYSAEIPDESQNKGQYSLDKIKELVLGRELEILEHVAKIPVNKLDGKGHPCPHPNCPDNGGDDRFALLKSKDAVHCRKCFNKKSGDCVAAIQWMQGVSFSEALRLIGNYLGAESQSAEPKNTVKTLAGEWTYTDEKGTPLYRVKRFEWMGNGVKKKSFVQEHYANGQYMPGLSDSLKQSGGVPLGLPDILKRKEEMLFIAEGEKCRDAIISLGLLATTASGGTANEKLHWPKHVQNRDVVILPDQDKAGYQYALYVADSLYRTNRIKIVHLPGLSEKGDVANWIERGGTKPELLQIIEKTPTWDGTPFIYSGSNTTQKSVRTNITSLSEVKPVIVSFEEIEEEEVSWLLQDIFPMGMVSVLAGKPGQSKSFLTCWLAAMVSCDDTVFFRRSPIPKGEVILCNAEDSASQTIKKRLRWNGANMSKVKTIPHVIMPGRDSGGKTVAVEVPITLEMIGAFEQAFEENPNCQLLIVDPVSAFWGNTNDQKNAEVRVIMARLKALAERFNVAIVLVTHLNKMPSADSGSRITGSGGLPAAGRANWLLTQDETGLRTVSLIKGNVTENKVGFTFRVIEGKVTIIDSEVDVSADEMLQSEIDSRSNKGRKPEQLNEAMTWLEEFLRDGCKPVGSRNNPAEGTVYYEAKQKGISACTLQRAEKELGIRKHREGYAYFWNLPTGDLGASELSVSYSPWNSEAPNKRNFKSENTLFDRCIKNAGVQEKGNSDAPANFTETPTSTNREIFTI